MDNYNNADYLDQIAPQAPPKKGLAGLMSNKMMIIVGGALVAVIITVVVLGILGSAPKKIVGYSEQLYQRLLSLQVYTSTKSSKDYCRRMRNSDLKALCTELSTYLTDLVTKYPERLTAVGAKATAITKAETDMRTNYAAVMSKADLNAMVDKTYADWLLYQLDTTLTLVKTTFSYATGAKYQEVLEQTNVKIAASYKRLKTFVDNGYSVIAGDPE